MPAVTKLDLEEFLDILKQLVRHPSVVGSEHAFFRYLQRELEETHASVTLYEGLLVASGEQPDKMHISAHVDRHGLICTGPNEFQYAAFVARNRGDLLGDSVSEQTFQTIAERFHERFVQAYVPWSGTYLGKGTIKRSYLCERRGNLVFEVEGLDHVLPGTPVAYQDRLSISYGRVSAQLDNVLTTAMLIYLFRQGFQGTALFTAQEEAGRSWRFLLEWFRRCGIETQDLLVLDTSPFPDIAAADAQQVVLRKRDANAVFNPQMVARLETACQKFGIRYMFKDEMLAQQNEQRIAEGKNPTSLGSTELGRVASASQGSIQGATLQVPTTGYHTPEESAALSSIEAMLDVLCEVALGE
ncbi:peptidase M42 [Blastopirellula marina]|uniref:Peptidase M42 n=1 Tax=Blastopirellula marina TaxID=124 RepID=A0A2S8F7Z8_9BACT|nr:peptidase M42 [Blastopirellula marina]PTL41816.1 peptidase M42 [Blastopirellula marina]